MLHNDSNIKFPIPISNFRSNFQFQFPFPISNSNFLLPIPISNSNFDFAYSLSSEGVDTTDNTDDVLTNTKVATLDPSPVADGIQHKLRPHLRNKYRQHPLSDTEEYAGAVCGNVRMRRGGHPGGVKITDFGMIDQPQENTLSDERYEAESGCTK